MNILKTSQETRGPAALTHRQSALETAALCPVQAPAPAPKVPPPPRRRLQIAVQVAPQAEVSHAVKIVQVGQD